MNFPGFASLTAGTGIPGINPLGFFVPNYNITVTPTQNPMTSHYKNIHSMKTQMPTDILEMFKANEIVFIKPARKRKCRSYDSLLLYNKDIIEKLKIFAEQQKQPYESKNKQKDRKRKEKELNHRMGLIQKMDQWNPFENPQHSQDPFKTLFVSKLNYKTTENTLYDQFRVFGPIKKVKIVKDLKGRSKGYGFIQFEQTQHFVNAYKKTNHRMLDNRRIIVDKERGDNNQLGRTEVKFRPMRLGQGLGGQSRKQKNELQQDILLQKPQKQQKQQAKGIRKKIKEAEEKEKKNYFREYKEFGGKEIPKEHQYREKYKRVKDSEKDKKKIENDQYKHQNKYEKTNNYQKSQDKRQKKYKQRRSRQHKDRQHKQKKEKRKNEGDSRQREKQKKKKKQRQQKEYHVKKVPAQEFI